METLAVAMSADEFHALPERDDGSKCELIGGVLVVSPSPSVAHEMAFTALFGQLWGVVGAARGIQLIGSRSDQRFGPETILSPDLCIVAKRAGGFSSWADLPVPLLVVEILSSSTARRDRGVKREFYQRAGVGEYWVVDLKRRQVERWWPGSIEAEVVRGRLEVRLGGGVVGAIDLDAVFQAVDG